MEKRTTTAFEKDIAIVLRLEVNDSVSTEVLLGWVQDFVTSVRFQLLEASKRFGGNWLLTVKLCSFLNQRMEDLFPACTIEKSYK